MSIPIVSVRPYIVRNAIIAFSDGTEEGDFAEAISEGTITPNSGTVEFKGSKPTAVFTYPQATTYLLNLTFAQDWSNQDSLSWYLYNHRGQTLEFTLNPDDTTADPTVGSTEWNGLAAIAPGAVGGPVDSVAVTTVALGCVGEPTPTFTAGTPAP